MRERDSKTAYPLYRYVILAGQWNRWNLDMEHIISVEVQGFNSSTISRKFLP